MYLPAHFAMSEPETLAVLHAIGTANLVTVTSTGLVATRLPLLYVPPQSSSPSTVTTTDPSSSVGSLGSLGSLHGHVARANGQWKTTLATTEALVVIDGVDAYVSPSGYPSKQEHGKVVPTWNYEAVHAYGTFAVHDDAAWTRDLVRRLTNHHEARHAQARVGESVTGRAWSIDDAPSEFIDAQLRAIVGIEIILTRIEGKAKLSQNRSNADANGVIEDLTNGSEHEKTTAQRMLTVQRES